MNEVIELLESALKLFADESKEKPCHWDGAIDGNIRGAISYYHSRIKTFNDVDGFVAAKADAEKAAVEATNAKREAAALMTEAKKMHAQAEEELKKVQGK